MPALYVLANEMNRWWAILIWRQKYVAADKGSSVRCSFDVFRYIL